MKRIISLLFLLLIIFIGCTPKPPKPDTDGGTDIVHGNNNDQPAKQDSNRVANEETEPDTTKSVDKEEIHDYIVKGYQFASASQGIERQTVTSPTMDIVQNGGQFEKLNETLSLLNLALGDSLECHFKLPETAFDVKATIIYKGQDDGIKGRFRWNKTLLPEDQAVLLKADKSELAEGTGLTQKVISLEKSQRENELKIFSLGESLQILNVKITYSYRMPCCTVGDVTVKLLSPDSDKDVLTPDLTLKWTRTGLCDIGRIIFKYKDGEEWKTVPGTESFDIGDDAWEDKSSDEFVWKNHGLKVFPELKIEYKEDESLKQNKTQLANETKTKEEKREQKTNEVSISENQNQHVNISPNTEENNSDITQPNLNNPPNPLGNDPAWADIYYQEAIKQYNAENYKLALQYIDWAINCYPDEDYKNFKTEIENEAKKHTEGNKVGTTNDPFFKAGEKYEKEINGVKFVFHWCPADTFMMGSPEVPNAEKGRYSDETQHKVTLSKGFWMMETEVTQKQWKAIMGYWNNPSFFKGDNLPVERVSWKDCQDFCKQCFELGLPVQLPTEAQWEYACRAGTTGPFAGVLDDMAWYSYNSKKQTHPVGTKKPNSWGLFDMHGNVREWCADWKSNYTRNNITDPMGDMNGTNRVQRGGTYASFTRGCRSAVRMGNIPEYREEIVGFRCVINPK